MRSMRRSRVRYHESFVMPNSFRDRAEARRAGATELLPLSSSDAL
jgi:hypothetical protein